MKHFKASGNTLEARLQSVLSQIQPKRVELEQAESRLKQLNESLPALREAYISKTNQKNGGYCAQKYSLSNRRKQCQDQIDAEWAVLRDRLNDRIRDIKAQETLVAKLQSELDVLLSSEAQINAQIQAYNTFVQQAAESGLSPEAAHQQAMQQVEAENQKMQSAAKKASSRRMLMVAGILVAVALAGFFVYNRFIKK